MSENHIERLNHILRTIRGVNQLLVKEKDRVTMIQAVCDCLVRNRSYFNAWIALLDEDQHMVASAEAGVGHPFSAMVSQIERGALPACGRQALQHEDVFITEVPKETCADCPLSGTYEGRSGIASRLWYDGKVYGLMCVSVPREVVSDEQEHSLLREVSEDIAYWLSNIASEEQRILAERALKERIKELNCLFEISKLVEKRHVSLEDILQGTAEIVPTAFQFHDDACARIVFGDGEFRSARFEETPWALTNPILIHDRQAGRLEVFYRQEHPDLYDGPFLEEEKALLKAVAERVGRIIERKSTEQALEESERNFRNLVENSLTGISIIQDDKIVYRNPEQQNLLAGLPHLFHHESSSHIHPEDLEKVDAYYQRLSSGDIESESIDFRFYPPDRIGSKPDMKWVHCRASPLEHKGKTAVLINLMDIKKSKELERLLLAQEKMASLGRVAAGIAHEIRNPLSGVNIYLSTLLRSIEQGPDVEQAREIIDQVLSASGRIEAVIKRVMDFSRPSEPSLKPIDMNEPVREALELSSVTLRKSGVNIVRSLSDDLLRCEADSQMLAQVVLNLVTNAAEAMRNGAGEKTIRVSTAAEDEHVVLAVEDSGPGIPQAQRDRVFDPFFTTKDWSTGIGLAVCQRIVADHGGSMNVTGSELGGAEFRVLIPKTKRHA